MIVTMTLDNYVRNTINDTRFVIVIDDSNDVNEGSTKSNRNISHDMNNLHDQIVANLISNLF